MNTTFPEAVDHAEYFSELSGQSITWVYNKTHGPIIDGAEAVGLNFNGFSPNTANLLLQQWTQFHEANKDNPDAKCLQYSHSQGAIHVKNALQMAPPEIRNRVISVAFAPADIIPKGLCYDAHNSASKNDPVPVAKAIVTGLVYGVNVQIAVMEDRKYLTIVESHPDETGIGHGLQNPSFTKLIELHSQEYLKNKEDPWI